jgi:hypothetical protein
VPLAPVLAKLRAAGGDPARVLTLKSQADLLRLQPGERYKFSLPVDGRFVVGPQPANAPGNVYSHPILSGGAPVLTAGGLAVQHDGASVLKVTVDQDSQSYCTTAESLQAALLWMVAAGVPAERLRVENRPPDCPEPRPDTWPPVWPPGSRFASPAPAAPGSRRASALQAGLWGIGGSTLLSQQFDCYQVTYTPTRRLTPRPDCGPGSGPGSWGRSGRSASERRSAGPCAPLLER